MKKQTLALFQRAFKQVVSHIVFNISVISCLTFKPKIYIYHCFIFINFMWVHFSAYGTIFILVLLYRILNFLPSLKSSADLITINQVTHKCINRTNQVQSLLDTGTGDLF